MKRSKDKNDKFDKSIIDDQRSSNLFKSTQVQKGYFLKTSKLMIFAHVHVFEKQSVQCFTPSNSHNTVSNSHQDLLLGRTMYNIQLLYIYHIYIVFEGNLSNVSHCKQFPSGFAAWENNVYKLYLEFRFTIDISKYNIYKYILCSNAICPMLHTVSNSHQDLLLGRTMADHICDDGQDCWS